MCVCVSVCVPGEAKITLKNHGENQAQPPTLLHNPYTF